MWQHAAMNTHVSDNMVDALQLTAMHVPNGVLVWLQLTAMPVGPAWRNISATSVSCLMMSLDGTSTTAHSATSAVWEKGWARMLGTACSATAA